MQSNTCLSFEDYVVMVCPPSCENMGSIERFQTKTFWPLLPSTVQQGHDGVATAKSIPVLVFGVLGFFKPFNVLEIVEILEKLNPFLNVARISIKEKP